ncbi:MAG TPA: DUF4163 domain-containing protein [Candidatus Lachnoclostridium stercoravium]|uniref:DUF4163 domain-containing protein n=1 Tax=Candidatus Lachnoclostridium stercoravium TaxID=2838633 RepID=A0A9D2KPN8_9FIRM|nr:DUF4163 domain-containing protein [Candidatus Lachnoclostridium stercoravium]
MKRTLIIPALILAGVCAVWGCGSKNKTDLTSAHTTAAAETMAPSQTEPSEEESVPEVTAADESSESEGSSSFSGVTVDTYSSNNISIEYPSVSDSLSSNASAVNELLKNNALSVISAYGIDEASDSLSVDCKIISANKQRLTAVYTGELSVSGGAHPTAVYYTNTVDLEAVSDIGLSTYADPYTMAGYVMSDDCQFQGLTAEQEQAVKEYKAEQSVSAYQKIFQNADFPLKGDSFPESFSYEVRGEIYLSIPVPHALGDYAIVVFTPETK